MDNGDRSARLKASRGRFQSCNEWAKTNFLKDDRVILLAAWLSFEKENGDKEGIEVVEKKNPKAIKKRRRVMDANGVATGWEEYFDYIFPEDGGDSSNLKLLQLAHQWKLKMAEKGEDPSSSDDEASD